MILKFKVRGFYAFSVLDVLGAFLYLCFSVADHGRLTLGRVVLPWAFSNWLPCWHWLALLWLATGFPPYNRLAWFEAWNIGVLAYRFHGSDSMAVFGHLILTKWWVWWSKTEQ
jgi:hypothetical protein